MLYLFYGNRTEQAKESPTAPSTALVQPRVAHSGEECFLLARHRILAYSLPPWVHPLCLRSLLLFCRVPSGRMDFS